MADQLEVARDVMRLMDTIQEGLEHINEGVKEGMVLDTAYLFDDIVQALISILNSLQPIFPHLTENRLESLTAQLLAVMRDMTSGYERNDEEKTAAALQALLPEFENWKNELDRCLTLYIAS